MPDESIRTALLAEARKIAENAYAPYSHFRVGAACRTADGETFVGVNVENGSYGLTVCAERTAIAAAITAGAREITHIALACLDKKDGPCLPCGACRQWIAELAPDAEILTGGIDQPLTIGDLLPRSFSLDK